MGYSKKKQEKAVLQGHTESVNTVAVTYDNKYAVSGSNDYCIIVWNLQQKQKETSLLGHTSHVNSVAITHDNKHIVSGSIDETVRVWDFQENKIKAVLRPYWYS